MRSIKQLSLFPLDSQSVRGDVAKQQGGGEGPPKEVPGRGRRPRHCYCSGGRHGLEEVTCGEAYECQQRDYLYAAVWWLRESEKWHAGT